MSIALGDEVQDSVSGYEGTVIARTEWLYGCWRYGVQAEGLTKDGKPHEAQWFDEQSLSKLATEPGGPCPGDHETG